MRRKLLVADDSVTIQRVVALSFADEDVEIEFAGDGDRALEIIRESRPDFVLADVRMPGLTGYQVCENVKSDPSLEHIPVVLLVGTFEPFDPEEASRVRSNGHLTKPFDTDELIHTYRALVETPVNRDEPQPASTPEPVVTGNSGAAMNPMIAGGILVSLRTRESFLGENRILEIIPAENRSEAPPRLLKDAESTGISPHVVRSTIEDIVHRLAPEIVREVAWEVVPEMSEMMIRESLNKDKLPEH